MCVCVCVCVCLHVCMHAYIHTYTNPQIEYLSINRAHTVTDTHTMDRWQFPTSMFVNICDNNAANIAEFGAVMDRP